MESKVMVKDKPIFRVNLFFLATMIWSIIIQFIPIPANSYQYIAFLIPISIYLFFNRMHLESILRPKMLNLKSILIILFIWLSILPVLYFIVELYVSLFGNTLADIVSEDSHHVFLFNLFFVAITPAVIEEILMRGIILHGYRDKSKFVAALMNGLLFGMLHLNSFQFFHTFIAGFIAVYLVLGTNSIFAGILIHVINNGLPLTIDYLFPINSNVGYAEDPNFLSLGLFAILGVIMVFFLIKLLFKVNNIPFKENRYKSDERIFNLPLIVSIFVFLGISIFILYSI